VTIIACNNSKSKVSVQQVLLPNRARHVEQYLDKMKLKHTPKFSTELDKE